MTRQTAFEQIASVRWARYEGTSWIRWVVGLEDR